MVSVKGLCATIALLCIIIPIGIGHIMPYDHVEQTGWESSNRVNVTSDLITQTTTYYTELKGDFNNISMLMTYPIKQGSVKTSVPIIEQWPTTHNDGTPGDIYYQSTSYGKLDIGNYISEYGDRHFYYTIDGVTTYFDSCVYNAVLGTLMVFTDSISYYVKPLPDKIVATETYSYYTYDYTGTFAQPSFASDIHHNYFTNGYENQKVSFIITALTNRQWSGNLDIHTNLPSPNNLIQVHLEKSSVNKWDIGNNNPSLFTYKQVLVEIDGASNKMTLYGLVYDGNYSKNPYDRVVDSVAFDLAAVSDGYTINGVDFAISTTYPGDTSVYCYSAYVPVTYQNIIKDASLSMSSYYQKSNISMQIADVAIYGDSVRLPGTNTDLAVTNGKITVSDLGGEDHTINLKDSVIVAVYNQDNTYTMTINGITYADSIAENNLTIIFNGLWYFSAYMFQATPYTYYEYLYDYTQNNLSNNAFCLVGMLTAALTFALCVIIGRKTEGKWIWCGAIAALAFIVYVAMLQ